MLLRRVMGQISSANIILIVVVLIHAPVQNRVSIFALRLMSRPPPPRPPELQLPLQPPHRCQPNARLRGQQLLLEPRLRLIISKLVTVVTVSVATTVASRLMVILLVVRLVNSLQPAVAGQLPPPG